MMQIQQKIEILTQLGNYLQSEELNWLETKDIAYRKNFWFIPKFIDQAVEAIAQNFLKEEALVDLIQSYGLTLDADIDQDKKLGIVMAGNIPLVGFHDFLMGFLAGYDLHIKLSSKDDVLLKHLVQKMIEWEPSLADRIHFKTMLKDCDLYIATGSNNTAQTFEYYFSKYPNLIRHNRTSIAVLTGEETDEDLKALVTDIYQYFGLGCRNVSKIFVPIDYDFKPLLASLNKHAMPNDHHQYLNNYDYQLALVMLNGVQYMSGSHILLTESTSDFAPLATLHYAYYDDIKEVEKHIKSAQDSLQTVVSNAKILGALTFGSSQSPSIKDFADGEDTFAFLLAERDA